MEIGGYPPGVNYGDPFAPWNGDFDDDETEQEQEEEEENESEAAVQKVFNSSFRMELNPAKMLGKPKE